MRVRSCFWLYIYCFSLSVAKTFLLCLQYNCYPSFAISNKYIMFQNISPRSSKRRFKWTLSCFLVLGAAESKLESLMVMNRSFFGKKIVEQIPLSRFSSEFWAFWYIVGLKQIIIAKVMSIWSSLVISIILSVYLICYHICYPN